MNRLMICVLCGGDHAPELRACDDDGIDRVVARIGAARWNRLSRMVWRDSFKAALDEIKRGGLGAAR